MKTNTAKFIYKAANTLLALVGVAFFFALAGETPDSMGPHASIALRLIYAAAVPLCCLAYRINRGILARFLRSNR